MKSFRIIEVAVFITGLIMFTSCLGSSEGSSSGAGFGYASLKKDVGIVVTDDFGSAIVSEAFNVLNGGEYVSYYGVVDWGAQTSTDYTIAMISKLERYPEIPTYITITDSTTVLSQELPIDHIFVNQINELYVLTANKHMFMVATHKNVPSDIKTDYYFSYDDNVEPSIVGNVRVYDFYLRAVKVADGTKVSTDTSIMGAYDLSTFLNQKRPVEKTLGNLAVNIRIHYVKDIKDNTLCWETSNIYSFVIPEDIKK